MIMVWFGLGWAGGYLVGYLIGRRRKAQRHG
jgi:hypothetical protein